ncbi:Tag1p SCDLUD_003462 [Saccharomycodes ludwigii]|uniref:Tag1p n=1 Tax=Saccharomycodes ludwigii TaxID=36035 RepID=UPI001E82637A|nr:hypothetical protein SCDLUD_003462 [Saccharomycodes ludwigii]KAH3900477.1 hypothetical protein SCDLUD_003462 [Saccharomycodes ludwigii]
MTENDQSLLLKTNIATSKPNNNTTFYESFSKNNNVNNNTNYGELTIPTVTDEESDGLVFNANNNHNQDSTAAFTRIINKNKTHPFSLKRIVKILTLMILVLLFVSLLFIAIVFIYPAYKSINDGIKNGKNSDNSTSTDDGFHIDEYISNSTDIKINNMQWHLVDKIKTFELEVNANLSFNYQQLPEEISNKNRTDKLLLFGANYLVKNVCLDVDDIILFEKSLDVHLGEVRINKTLCFSVKNNDITTLTIPMVLKPDWKNLFKVLKKISNGEQNDLEIWSTLNLNIWKNLFLIPFINNNKDNRNRNSNALFKLPLLKNLRIDYFDWSKFIPNNHTNDDTRLGGKLIDLLRHHEFLESSIQFDNLELSRLPDKDVPGFLMKLGFNIPSDIISDNITSGDNDIWGIANSVLDGMCWAPVFPDCDGNLTINLENEDENSSESFFKISFETEPTDYDATGPRDAKGFITGQVKGNLPPSLLLKVCDSNEEDVITPMSKLLANIFNATEPLQLGVYPSLSPHNVFPLNLNFSLNSSDIIENVGVSNNLRIIRNPPPGNDKNRGQYSITGNAFANVAIGYISKDFEVNIRKLKGTTRIFDTQHQHFMNLNLNVWEDCTTRQLADKHDGLGLKVEFPLDNSEIQIVNNKIFGKCLQELFIHGEFPVLIEGILDLMIECEQLTDGQLILTGIPGEGKTKIKN